MSEGLIVLNQSQDSVEFVNTSAIQLFKLELMRNKSGWASSFLSKL